MAHGRSQPPRGSGHRRRGSDRSEDGRFGTVTDIRSRLQRLRRQDQQRYVLRLYVTGVTRASANAIERVRALCEERLQGRYQLEVIDIYQLPALAKGEQIVATPTLIRVLPEPLRRFIGNLANAEKIIFGLDLWEKGS